MHWIEVDALGEHFEEARIDARIADQARIRIALKNITAFTIRMGPGQCPLDITRAPVIEISGQQLVAPRPLSDRSWNCSST